MDFRNKIFFAFVVFISLLSCGQLSKHKNAELMIAEPEYDLNNPHHAVRLPKELKEISGIAYYRADSLLAIQDEDGLLFMISSKSGEILQSTPFAGTGDYEGIAFDGKYIYVLRSDAKIFKVSMGHHPDSLQTSVIESSLDSSFDAEGICYDPKTASLLIVCKESGRGVSPDRKNIYRYHIPTAVFDTVPAFSIKHAVVRDYLKSQKSNPELKELQDLMDFGNEEIFVYPSDIAIHPLSGDIYILSSKGRSMMLVFSPDAKLKSIQTISKKLLPQAEGICFTPEADLIISSEGKAKKDRLFIFKPIKK